MRVLAVNAGSSSLKLRLLDGQDRTVTEHELAAPRAVVDEEQLRAALQDGLGDADAVGHRIVHGGERFRAPVVMDSTVEEALRELSDLAPLHQPKSLAALDAVTRALPEVPAVACFDTAFHATLAPAAATYALPRTWRERWPLRRYGFHGLSHAYVAGRAAELLGRPMAELRIVSCHLGAGASLCAIQGGRSIDTTMGFTPLEGLVMATRSGSVDPGLLLWLLEHERLGVGAVAQALEHESGLLGLAGTANMRDVLARAQDGDGDASLAVEVYVHRLRASIAAMAVALDGLDAVVFTGGVGERAAALRAHAAAGLSLLGIALDAERNAASSSDADIGTPGALVRTLVITAREDLQIAREVRGLLSRDSKPADR